MLPLFFFYKESVDFSVFFFEWLGNPSEKKNSALHFLFYFQNDYTMKFIISRLKDSSEHLIHKIKQVEFILKHPKR